jgi:starch phosphorylase
LSATDPYVHIPSRRLVDIVLPSEVARLASLAYNLWWSWTSEARQLFSAVDQAVWARYRNPVELLLSTERSKWEVLIQSEAFMSAYSGVVNAFDRYMSADEPTWFKERNPEGAPGPFAYFSMEFGVHQSLAIYSGGLGVLSGDHCKSASDLGVPLIAVGPLYRYGYFRQTLDADGFQQHHYPEYDFGRLPLRPVLASDGAELVVRVPFPDREVAVKVWLAQVGRVPLLLLDTDLLENELADRAITNVLYVRGREMRLAQEMVLGAGGAAALEALGIRPVGWHINEGHSALLQLERLRELTEADSSTSFDDRLRTISSNTAFTTHTPVPAGNEQFDPPLARRYLEPWSERLGVSTDELLQLGYADHGEPDQPFNLTALGLRTSRFANGVSQLNAKVVNEMWSHLLAANPGTPESIVGITNGVHAPTWLGLELRRALLERLGRDWLHSGSWDGVEDVPDREIWEAHRAQKKRLGRFLRSRMHEQMARHGRSPSELRRIQKLVDSDALTVGFARRFATYKRAGLIFHDLHRLRQLISQPGRPVQIVMAGKAHPADRPGQALIRHIFQLSQEPDLRGRVVFLEDYDIRVGRMLVQGVDVWLNNPLKPMEASGTSGMKAAMNGVLNLSVSDGWWPEGYTGDNGWTIESNESLREEWERDQADALALYQKLEDEVVPAFYDRDEEGLPRRWVAMMKRSIATVGPQFSSDRMVRDYVEKAYLPLVE